MSKKAYHDVVEKIITLLNKYNCEYETFEHEPVRTSEEAAATRIGYSLSQGAKALIVRLTHRGEERNPTFAQLVVPGDTRFNSSKVRKALDIKDVRFATEEEVIAVTGGVLPGGVPPFGSLFGIPVYCDQRVLNNDRIVFNAGDRRYSIGMNSGDYKHIEQPIFVDII